MIIITRKYCSGCGKLLELNRKWYCVYDKIYCSLYEATMAEQKLFTSKKI